MRVCEVDGCEQQHHARGYCIAHHAKARRQGLLVARPVNPVLVRVVDGKRLCTVDGCDQDHYGRGLCKSHHTRLVQTGSVRGHVPLRPMRRQWFGRYNDGQRVSRHFDPIDTDEL